MATFPREFVDLAAELIGDEFAPFTKTLDLKNAGGFDYATQTVTTEQTQSIPAIRLEFEAESYANQAIMVGDFMLIAEYQKITIPVRPDSTSGVFDGQSVAIKSTEIDPAGATIIMHVRRL